jgi:hypothetical protein
MNVLTLLIIIQPMATTTRAPNAFEVLFWGGLESRPTESVVVNRLQSAVSVGKKTQRVEAAPIKTLWERLDKLGWFEASQAKLDGWIKQSGGPVQSLEGGVGRVWVRFQVGRTSRELTLAAWPEYAQSKHADLRNWVAGCEAIQSFLVKYRPLAK